MHLDTYFNIIDHDLATLCANRVEAGPGDVDFLTADVYAKNAAGVYEKIVSGTPFTEFLAGRGIRIIPIGKEDELNYANNFLTVGARQIVMVAGQSPELQSRLREEGVDVTWAYLQNLTRGYGAAHCMTQVVRRVPQVVARVSALERGLYLLGKLHLPLIDITEVVDGLSQSLQARQTIFAVGGELGVGVDERGVAFQHETSLL